jgi:hypothetical protein
VQPKLWTILLVPLIAAIVWSSAYVQVSAPESSVADALPTVMPFNQESPGEVRLMAARALAREAVGRELLAGRLTVPEAAAVFEWLDYQHPALTISMIEAANRIMASGSPVGSELSAGARHEGEWLCLRTAGHARDLAWKASPERAEALSVALDDGLIRAWKSGEARALPAVDAHGCRTLLQRAREVPFGTPGQQPPVDASDLRLVDRE